MTILTPPRARTERAARAPGGVVRAAAADLAVGLLPLLAVAGATWGLLALPASYLSRTLALYGIGTGLILFRLPPSLPGKGLGAANRVTLARATLVLPVAALALQPGTGVLRDGALWWLVAASALALVLDGVDGRVARRTGTATAFGGRFDMELDALLLLALAALVWRSGQVGAWVLLIGALRYLFVAAGAVWPVLRAELQPSLRRKTACVVQGVALVVCLAPVVAPGAASGIAAGALALLVHSFAVDVRWLLLRPTAAAAGS